MLIFVGFFTKNINIHVLMDISSVVKCNQFLEHRFTEGTTTFVVFFKYFGLADQTAIQLERCKWKSTVQ